MGILDFFKLAKKEDDTKLIELQNILFKMNSNKLQVSKKQLNDTLNRYVSTHSKVVNECVILLGDTNNPDTFFTRFNLLIDHLKALSKVERHYSFSRMLPSAQLKKLSADKEMMANAFIDKSWEKLLSKISSLKTEKTKQNNINKFFENMNLYKNNMSGSSIEHLSKLKDSINPSKVKTNATGKVIYDELKKELDASLYEYVYSRSLSDETIHKFFPEGIPKQTVFHIVSESFKGRRPESINTDICKVFFDISNKNLEKITQTICSISSAALEMFQSQKMGLNWYIWHTSEDSKVRSSHKHINDVLINWNDPPSPESLVGEEFIGKYHPGECFQCRCLASPVVKLDFISWPHEVFYQNRIQTMTKEQFKSIM